METISYVLTDRRIKNAVIRKICKESNIDNTDNKIYCNEYYNYMEYDNDISIMLLSTIYKGIIYTFEYKSGCFNAYMVATVVDFTFDVNEDNHYTLYDKDKNIIFAETGWKVDSNPQRLYKNYIGLINIIKKNICIITNNWLHSNGAMYVTVFNKTKNESFKLPKITFKLAQKN